MKATLNIPWNLLREIRWLATFNIKFSSEGNVRDVAKEWVGKGLKSEYAPLIVIKNKKREVKSIPSYHIMYYSLNFTVGTLVYNKVQSEKIIKNT